MGPDGAPHRRIPPERRLAPAAETPGNRLLDPASVNSLPRTIYAAPSSFGGLSFYRLHWVSWALPPWFARFWISATPAAAPAATRGQKAAACSARAATRR